MRLPKIIIRALLLAVCYLLFTANHVSAQNYPPVKDPNCDSIKLDPNYHSLRPFPFMPCDKEIKETVIQCGNTVYASNVIDKDICSNCMWTTQPGNCTCNYSGDYSGNVTIDFSNSELPIVGNTEDVWNWETTPNNLDELDHPTKMNDYVSWYLNGVINRAEYPFLFWKGKNQEKVEADRRKIIDFSGPIRKLLPQRIQDDSRESQVTQSRDTRHNQIAACTFGYNILIPFFNIQIGRIPVPCLDFGWIANIFNIKNVRLDEWKNHLPPKREDSPRFIDYYKKYRAWRGDTCFSVPFPFVPDVEIMLCFDNPLNPNFYGDLFPYIPYTSTEDRVGEGTADVPSEIGSDNLKLFNILYDANDLKLYYAHMQETVELSDLLKKSFVPKEGSGDAAPTVPVEVMEGCKILDIRTNQGDHLVDPNWKWLPDKAITGTLSYDYEFKCEFNIPANEPPPHLDSCKVTPTIPISLDTANPLHDQLWSNLVADYNSPFRRIFPKLGSEPSDLCLEVKDMPGSTKFDTSADDYSLQTGGEVYFPHLGGISEYFLKGIQTILRPKGYGEPIAGQSQCRKVEIMCDQNVPDSAVPPKYLGAFKSNFINLADRWSQKCPGPDNNLAEECYNYVASEANKAGVNPAFALTIWLNESGASNYCEGGSTTQDFGVNLSSIYQNITEQLKAFLNMAIIKFCEGVIGFTEPMHGWLSRFQSSAGVCDPLDPVATQYYYDVRDNTWSWVTGCSSGGKFGIDWPTDMSCP